MDTQRPIRIGLIAPTLQIPGGHAVQAARLLAAWRGDGTVQARLVPINPPPPAPFAALSAVKIVRTALTQLCYWPSLLREMPTLDVVHVFTPSNSSFFRSSLPAILVAWLHGKRVIVNYRGDGREHLSRSRLTRRVMRSVDVIAVPSGYFAEIFRELNLQSHVVPNIADLAAFRYRVRDPIGPRFISTRHFEPLYNVQCTLRAFARVQARYPDATLVLAGGGSQERHLRRLAQQLTLRGVTFTGPVTQRTISALYDAADIYVQTPVIDNMPGSLVEAFACGLPVVATSVGGVPVILQHGVHGLLAPSGDDEAVASQMMHMLEHPDAARRMAMAARSSSNAYDAAVVREKWRAVYVAVASPRDGRLRRDHAAHQ